MINGLFIWFVFLSHIGGYMDMPTGDVMLRDTVTFIGQCMVATFFFFSGYGIMASLKHKGRVYGMTLLRRRLPFLWFHFAVAVLIFVAVQYPLGVIYPLQRILGAIVAWDSVGNSNWFIGVTFIAYLFISLSYILWHKRGNLCVVASVAILFCVFIELISRLKAGYWVDTCLCIPAGMLFCELREKAELLLRYIPLPVWCIGVLLLIAGLLIYRNPISCMRYYVMNIGAILFAMGVLFACSGITLKRKTVFLCWSGGPALFFLYIFQRIPMILGAHWGWQTSSPYLYELFCITASILIAWLCTKIFAVVDRFLIARFTI